MARKTKKKTKKPLRIQKETISSIRSFPVVEKEEKDNEIVDKIKKTKISVIGIGGGGGTIISEIAFQISKASFVAANTDFQALRTINKKVGCFQFGQKLTHGLGTGMRVDLGREAAQNEKDKIKKLCQGQDLCIIVACLGGGTGSGAAPVFAKISKSLGNLTYGIFTLPFQFEGGKKMEIAKDALKKATSHLDAITLIPNERVFQIIDKDTPLKQALSVINKDLAKGLEGLIETIYEPGLINIDFADFNTVFKNKGKLAYLNTVETSIKEGSIKDLMTRVLNSLLYTYTIQGAKGVLFNISGGKNLSLSEVSQISKSISELVSPEAKIIFGTRIREPSISKAKRKEDAKSFRISTDKKCLEPIIKTTLLAIGCEKGIVKKEKKDLMIRKKSVRRKPNRQALTIDEEKQVVEPKTKKLKEVYVKGRVETDFISKTKKEKEKKERKEKIKIKIVKRPEKEILTELPVGGGDSGIEINPVELIDHSQKRVRKNGLQIKKETQEFEKEILEKEKFWETPAFLRRKSTKLD